MGNKEDGKPLGRRKRRMSIGGAGRSGLSLNDGSQSYGAVGEDEAPDGDINEEVMEKTRQEGVSGGLPRDSEEFSPSSRMGEVRRRAGAYEREYRLQLLHRMLMRKVPLDEIARELEVSVQTVLRDRRELYHRLKEQAKSLDINVLIGDTIGFYDEVKSMGLRAASNSKFPMNARLGALRTSLAAKNDMHRFLQAAGVFDVLRFKSAKDNTSDDLSTLVELTKHILSSDDDKEFDVSDLPPLLQIEDEEDSEEEVKLF